MSLYCEANGYGMVSRPLEFWGWPTREPPAFELDCKHTHIRWREALEAQRFAAFAPELQHGSKRGLQATASSRGLSFWSA